ncbi:MAG: NADH-quinone oxidoreductase subunit C, partial [Bacteroidota bacterium]|nr:NADH-quinone oxidoreductase subunit C [Bacteroidota bacterium]
NGTIGAMFDRTRILDVARILKEQFGFTHFIDAFGVDRNERKMRFEMIYNLRNPATKERIFLKTRCDERDPHIPSVVSIWSAANWLERETFDMYGIIFDGHPDLRRMYMPDDFEYNPLRKDFPLMGVEGSLPLPIGRDMSERMN